MADEETKGGDVKVTDHRRFDEKGDVMPEVEREPESVSEGGPEVTSKAAEEPKGAQGDGAPHPIDFPTFLLSLATSAQVHLGAIPNPTTGEEERNLPLAKETIDLIAMLKEKTKGNLADDEGRLLDHLLYDLRMMYVDLSQQSEKSKQGETS